MRFVSYNIRSGLEQGLEAVAEVIGSLEADVVALQETDHSTVRSGGRDQAADLALRAGFPHAHFFAATPWEGGGHYGLGLLSREPLGDLQVTQLPIDGPDAHPSAREPRIVAAARLPSGLQVLNTHFGLTDSQRRRQARLVAGLLDEHTVLLGDFNAQPADPVLEPIRRVMQDSSAGVSPDERVTFPQPAPGIIIDYVFVGAALKVVASRVGRAAGGASDHYPLFVDLEFESPLR